MIKKILLWLFSILLAVSAMIYQRSTGPTYEYRGYFEHNGENYNYELLRSQETTEGAKIEFPYIENVNYKATLNYKRYQTSDEITSVSFKLNKDKKFIAQLPIQPSAGKIEYFISGSINDKEFQIPENGNNSIVLRYKDPVSSYILLPHVLMMIMVVIFGIRAGLSALFDFKSMRLWVVITFIAMTIGGMILGPLVQKSAFGEYWTGFPYGGDFTDNKTLIMWIAWALALIIIGLKVKVKENISRVTVLAAAVIMVIVYLIPHSLGGSTLDYDKVDKGIDPKEAIKTGSN